MNDFEKDLHIDKDSLDMECIRQPKLYMQYAEKVAKAEKELNNSKLSLDIIKAGADSSIRESAKIKNEKITEAIVTREIMLDEQVIIQIKKVNLDREEFSILQAAVKAMDHKKTMINNLVSLWIGSYYSTPSHKKEVTEEGQSKMQEEIRNKIKGN